MTDDYTIEDYSYDLPVWEMEYTMEEGDSLNEVANAFNTTVEAIAELNPDINATQITPGQNLRLQYRPRGCAGGTIYVVRRGDSLASIAARFRTTEAALRQANPFIGNFVRAGVPICIPPRFPVPVCPGGFFYTVAAGDNIYRIAARYGTTVSAIIRANRGLDPNRLFIGQRICIPVTPSAEEFCPGGRFYTIGAGDNLYFIASRFGTSVELILRANPGLNPNRLFIGQRICIPGQRGGFPGGGGGFPGGGGGFPGGM